MSDFLSRARETAEREAERLYPQTPHRKGDPLYPKSTVRAFGQGGYEFGFTTAVSRLPSEEELAEGLAASLWDRDTGDVEPWEKLSPAERENVIKNYDARDYAKLALSLIGEKISG